MSEGEKTRLVAWSRELRGVHDRLREALTASASVIVDFPASGWEITANVRRLVASCRTPAGAVATVEGCDPILLTNVPSRRYRCPPAGTAGHRGDQAPTGTSPSSGHKSRTLRYGMSGRR